MRKTLLIASTFLAVGGLAVAGLAVGGSAAAGSSARASDRTIVVVQRAPRQAFVDLGDPGPTPGDILVFRSALFDATNTSQVGVLNITCTQGIGAANICRGIFWFSGRGRISVDALPRFPSATTGIVNGGTGEFQLSRGEAHIQPQADGTTVITFHLFD